VNIRGQRATQRQPVRTGLLLKNAELRFAPALPAGKLAQQVGPFDAGLGFDGAISGIERYHPVQAAHVQEEHAGSELLPAHGVAAAGDADGQTLLASIDNGGAELILCFRADDTRDASAVQLGMDVVDFDVRLRDQSTSSR
jgi:hypothetical protein